ncbi:MAG: PorT family protein [Cyclobacteriaceae bacterium]|nr:PorT family protein [Cyclobacteriaceae bacterium]MDH4298108.1 PorT family protein [Cyclobacteriaceae bacterium]MDH5248203.1 PorT family protein [Cyclobacteriaceae bacterium]
MIKKLAGIVILSGISFMGISQTIPTKKTSGRPDIPGTFAVELGINGDVSGPKDFDLGFWGSRTVNIYYQYEFRILKSGFSFVPGIGLSMERYKFKNEYTLGYTSSTSSEIIMVPPEDAGVPNIQKSQLITNYIDVPVELRFSTNPDDPSRSFKISVGGRIGYLYDSFTKLKYKQNGEVKKLKDKQDFQLTKIRYGLTGRIGFGGFSLFGYYNLTPLFEEGKGLKENNQYNDFNTFTIGISFASF